MQKELSLWNLLLESAENSLISSAKDIGEGGLAMTLAKMTLGNGVSKPIGCNIHTNLPSQLLFSQSQSCVVAEITAENLQSFMQLAKKHKVPVCEIGCVGGEIFCVDEINMNLDEMAEVYFESFEKLINQDL